ncbi:MAG TPA: hypothetical protein VG934_03100 [Candidatus Paceibacterota bacterium]|nr:hypothetical protein [Candidatus Paceibacterota bacterium]
MQEAALRKPALALVPLEPQQTFGGKEAHAAFPHLVAGTRWRVTFRGTCEPDDVTLLLDMHGRKFLQIDPGDYGKVTAVYTSKNGWGHLARSFSFEAKEFSGQTGRENFMRLATRLETIELL